MTPFDACVRARTKNHLIYAVSIRSGWKNFVICDAIEIKCWPKISFHQRSTMRRFDEISVVLFFGFWRFTTKLRSIETWRFNWQLNNANIRNLIITLRLVRPCTITLHIFNGKNLLFIEFWKITYLFEHNESKNVNRKNCFVERYASHSKATHIGRAFKSDDCWEPFGDAQ